MSSAEHAARSEATTIVFGRSSRRGHIVARRSPPLRPRSVPRPRRCAELYFSCFNHIAHQNRNGSSQSVRSVGCPLPRPRLGSAVHEAAGHRRRQRVHRLARLHRQQARRERAGVGRRRGAGIAAADGGVVGPRRRGGERRRPAVEEARRERRRVEAEELVGRRRRERLVIVVTVDGERAGELGAAHRLRVELERTLRPHERLREDVHVAARDDVVVRLRRRGGRR